MTVKALIIDDERPARAELKKLLQDFPEIEIIPAKHKTVKRPLKK
ncbi:MAG: hypothetical protein PW786_04725 [Arachidicoccus sp.]|nr:hypothetical protein [Arachidicoccus sp.]